MVERVPQEFVDKWTKVIAAPVFPNNQVDWLIDGWSTFESMYSAIQTCLTGEPNTYYVYLLGWWLDETLRLKGNQASSEVLALFNQLANAGVQLRVMLYDNIFKSLYAFFYSRSLSPRAQIDAIGRMKGARAILDAHLVPHFTQSHHHKLLLVRGSKGLIGFCGGVDLALDRIQALRKHPGSPYHDVHCKIAGPAARGLVDVFVQRWSTHPDGEKTKAELRALRDMPATSGTGDEPGPGNARVGIVRTFIRPDGPCIAEQSIVTTLRNAIAAAKRFIYCEDQYMISRDVAIAIGQALSHVQFVFFLVPHSSISDLPGVWAAREQFIATVFANATQKDARKFHVFYKLGSKSFGVAKREVLHKPPHDPPTDEEIPTAGDFGAHTYVHAKAWIFDDELAIIGSANVNRRGLFFDSEVCAAIFDVPLLMSHGQCPFAQALRMQLWSEHLGVEPRVVQNALDARVQKMWWAASVQAYVRHYRQDDGSDAASASGWFFARPFAQSAPSSEATSPLDSLLPQDQAMATWDWLLDPSAAASSTSTMKKCPPP